MMEFDIHYEINTGQIKNSTLLICYDSICNQFHEAEPFSCSQESCRYSYGSADFYKLIIEYPDRIRESNVFQKTRYSSSFIVFVKQDNLYVKENFSGLPYEPSGQVILFIVALFITLLSELLVASIFFGATKLNYRKSAIVFANFISLPIVWFIFPFLRLESAVTLLLAEAFAFLFEAFYLHKMIEELSYKHSFVLSLLMNSASFLIPNILMARLYGLIY